MTIPDQLTFYRLASAPMAVGMILGGYRDAFFILIVISLVTDLVDGPLARWLGQSTRFGAKLDTIADACTLLTGIFGIYVFEGPSLNSDLGWLYLFLASYAAATITSLVKFRGLPAYHLYLSKAAAFCAALFFLWLYVVGYSRPFFLGVVALGIMANIESLFLTLRLRRFRSDITSIFSAAARGPDEGR